MNYDVLLHILEFIMLQNFSPNFLFFYSTITSATLPSHASASYTPSHIASASYHFETPFRKGCLFQNKVLSSNYLQVIN